MMSTQLVVEYMLDSLDHRVYIYHCKGHLKFLKTFGEFISQILESMSRKFQCLYKFCIEMDRPHKFYW